MFKETKSLIEKRAKLIASNRTLIDTSEARAEGEQNFTPEEKQTYDAADAEIDGLNDRIARIEKQNAIDDASADQLTKDADDADVSADELTAKRKEYSDAYWGMVRKGFNGITSEQKDFLSEGQVKDLEVGSGAGGGFTVPEDFSNEIDIALKEWGGMREAARIITTTSGADLPWPTLNDTTQEGELIAEGVQVAEQDLTFGSKTVKAFMYSSKSIPVSMQLLQDSAFDIPGLIRDAFVERIGRITNRHFTVGTAVAQPEGVSPASSSINAAANNAIASDEIIDLFHAVDPAYRKSEKARYMLNDATLKIVRKLKDDDGKYLWEPSMKLGVPDLLFGKPYIINQDMEDVGADQISMLFGDFNKFIIRDVMGFQFFRLDELLRLKAQVGFVGFQRTDSRLINAGTNPIKGLRHPNT